MMFCMGLEKNRGQCVDCKRLPLSPEDEDQEKWLAHLQMLTPCDSHLPLKIKKRRR